MPGKWCSGYTFVGIHVHVLLYMVYTGHAEMIRLHCFCMPTYTCTYTCTSTLTCTCVGMIDIIVCRHECYFSIFRVSFRNLFEGRLKREEYQSKGGAGVRKNMYRYMYMYIVHVQCRIVLIHALVHSIESSALTRECTGVHSHSLFNFKSLLVH